MRLRRTCPLTYKGVAEAPRDRSKGKNFKSTRAQRQIAIDRGSSRRFAALQTGRGISRQIEAIRDTPTPKSGPNSPQKPVVEHKGSNSDRRSGTYRISFAQHTRFNE